MPGDTSMRDQTLDKDRRKFTSALISALEESELRRLNRSPQQLADAAWQKLQYDFPLVETEELQALLEAFSASFVGKTAWPCYLLTHKALENISTGARGAGSYAPQLSEQEQQVQQMLSDSLTKKVLSRVSSNGTAQTIQQQQPASQQQLYQQLAAVLLLQYAAKVASLPEQEAWQLMQAYCPELQQQGHNQQQGQHEQQQAEQLAEASDAAIAAAAAGMVAAAGVVTPAAVNGVSSSCSIYEDAEAAQQDADSEEYEPLEAAQPHQHSSNSSHQQSQSSVAALPSSFHQQQDPQPFSWPALRHKLMSMSEHVHYSLLSYEPLWRQQDAAQHLLQLLRTLGVHSHTQELQPLLHAYVGLLVDRLAAAPQDLPLLHQLWEALGLTDASGLKQAGFRSNGGGKTQEQQGLYPEAVLGLSVAAVVWQQLPGATPRKQLWQLMHQDLLPLLESCAEQLAYSSKASSSKGPSSSTGAASTAGGACTQGMAFAHVLLLSHVLELLVLGRPGHVDVGKQLTDLGLTRSLVQLHIQWGCEAAAEPLRRALLLLCCSSPHTAAWALAVPAVKQQLQQQWFMLEGPSEAHGAVWQLLMHNNSNCSSQLVKAPAEPAAAAAAAASADDGAEQQLLSLLRLQSSSNVQQLQRQVMLLQLMVDVQMATASRQRLWSDTVLAALRKLAAKLKEIEGPAANGVQAAAASNKATFSSSDTDSDSEAVDCEAHGTAGDKQQRQQQATDVEQLQHRRSAQLQPTALRLVKELLTQGGGKTD